MNGGSPLHRFFSVYRDFGVVTAIRVTYSKLRGKLRPSLALPDAPYLDRTPHDLTVLFNSAEQTAAALDRIVEILAQRSGAGWDLCICERTPVEPEMARSLAACRGKYPWVRIVTTDGSVDETTASRWTVEQATGEFVALLAPGYLADPAALTALLTGLRNDLAARAATLRSAHGAIDCVLQRKSDYLANPPAHWSVTALTRE